MEGEMMLYALGVAVAALLGAGAGAYLHYRYGSSVKRVADLVAGVVGQAKSK